MSDNALSAEARASRLQDARKLAKLTLRGMCMDGNINFNTLCGWEAARHGGLTRNGAQKVIDRLSQEGIICTLDWLLTGTGAPPKPILSKDLTHSLHTGKNSLTHFIPTQICLMEQQFPEFMGLTLPDEAMAPHYRMGDYVTGMPLPLDALGFAIGRPIIATLKHHNTTTRYCRHLIRDNNTGLFSLVSSDFNAPDAILSHIQIVEFALILAHFHKDALYDPLPNVDPYHDLKK